MGVGILSQDHKGKWYDSRTEMCDWWGIRDNTYLGRVQRGYSVEEALTKEVAKIPKACTDHKGHHYTTEREMCRHYNIAPGTFRDRIMRGWSLEEALTSEIIPQLNKSDVRLGEKRRMKNGLDATIIKYKSAKSLTVIFEDGALGHGSIGNFRNGKIGHPTLHMRGAGTYCEFETHSALYHTYTNQTFYPCACTKCGVRDILMPQEMMEHYKACAL